MGNYKPRSKSDRIPIASLTPRQTMQADPVPNREAALTIAPLAADVREARNAAAVRYLLKRDAGDLIDMLGLGVQQRRPKVSVDSVPCEQCGAPPGQPCVASSGSAYNKGHQGRRRAAQELREATG
jgi:hypothetical protein